MPYYLSFDGVECRECIMAPRDKDSWYTKPCAVHAPILATPEGLVATPEGHRVTVGIALEEFLDTQVYLGRLTPQIAWRGHAPST